MKISIIKDQHTKIIDTERLKTCDEWCDLLGEIGKDLFRMGEEIEAAKQRRALYSEEIPPMQWQNMNNARYRRMKEWQTIAEHIVLRWPKAISFTTNKMATILSERDPSLYTEIFEMARKSPTVPRVGQHRKKA